MMSKTESKINPIRSYLNRIHKHLISDNHIEALFLLSAIVEGVLLKLIRISEETINCMLDVHEKQIDFSKYHKDKETLGDLLKHLSALDLDENLIKELKQLNATRIKCVHKLLAINPEDLNKEIGQDFPKYKKLLIDIFEVYKKSLNSPYNKGAILDEKLAVLKKAKDTMEKSGKKRISIAQKKKIISTYTFKPLD